MSAPLGAAVQAWTLFRRDSRQCSTRRMVYNLAVIADRKLVINEVIAAARTSTGKRGLLSCPASADANPVTVPVVTEAAEAGFV